MENFQGQVIMDSYGKYVVCRRNAKGGWRIATTENKDLATRFVTNSIFEVLEILLETEKERGWRAYE